MLTSGLHDVPPGCVATVVTILEMRAPPPPADPAPPVPGATLVHVKTPTRDWYRRLFTGIGGDWLWFSRLAMPLAELDAVICDPSVEIRVLRDGAGRDLAMLELDFRVPGMCELAFLGVTAGWRGRGAARMLMQAALARAWTAPIERLHLHTCTFDHPAALPFYLRSGFAPVATRVEITPDPRLSGLLPRDAAPHVPVVPVTP